MNFAVTFWPIPVGITVDLFQILYALYLFPQDLAWIIRDPILIFFFARRPFDTQVDSYRTSAEINRLKGLCHEILYHCFLNLTLPLKPPADSLEGSQIFFSISKSYLKN